MPLFPLPLPPGVFRNGTRYQAKNRWYEVDLVRWLNGALRPLGGWQPLQDSGGTTLFEEDFTDSDFVEVRSHTPSGTPAFPGAFDNGSGSGNAPSSSTNPARIITNEAWNNKTDGSGGRLVGAGTGVYDNFTVYADIWKAAIWGPSGGSGVIFRSNDHRHDPEDSSEQADDGDFCEWRSVDSSGSDTHFQFNLYIGGAVQATVSITSANATINQGDDLRVGATVVGDLVTLWWEDAAGGGGARTTVVAAHDMTHSGSLASLNTGTHDSFGVHITNRGVNERIDNLTVLGEASTIQTTGVPRSMHSWRVSTNRVPVLAIGTESDLYGFQEGSLTDITPAGFTAGNADSSQASGGYGTGKYGVGAYGVGDTTQQTLVECATWQLDNFGDDLIACATPDGKLYESDGTTQATALANAPTGCTGVVVTPERFIVALAAGGDARIVQWPDQESKTAWSSGAAGDFPLPTNGEIMCGRRGRGETLVWTDLDVWAMRYVGGTLVYGFQQIGSHCGIIARNAVAMVDGKAIWMGADSFFQYDGFVRDLPSDLSDHVFGRLNRNQRHKVVAVAIPAFGEVLWHYPSETSVECDEYVIYNYRENHWTHGRSMPRVGGTGTGAFDYPIMGDADGFIYEHERGVDHGAATPYAESGYVEIGNGDQVMQVLGSIPDEQTLGDVTLALYTSLYPTAAETLTGPFTAANPTDIRVTGRLVRLRVTAAADVDWRFGIPRLEVQAGGRR